MNLEHIKRIKVLERSLEGLLEVSKTVNNDNLRFFLKSEYKAYSFLIKTHDLQNTKLTEIRKDYLSTLRKLYQNI